MRDVPKLGACFRQAAFGCVGDGVVEDVTVTMVVGLEVGVWLGGAVVSGGTPVVE